VNGRLAQPDAAAWLREFALVLLGGGPVWPELAERAAAARVRAAQSYGMTETAAMVAAQRPEEFAAGDRSSGRALPHATLRTDADGRVVVGGASLFRGYVPEWREATEWVTTDLGEIDAAGRLHVAGRADAGGGDRSAGRRVGRGGGGVFPRRRKGGAGSRPGERGVGAPRAAEAHGGDRALAADDAREDRPRGVARGGGGPARLTLPGGRALCRLRHRGDSPCFARLVTLPMKTTFPFWRRAVLCVGLGAIGAVPALRAAQPAATATAENPMLARIFPSIVRIEAIRLRPSDGRLTKQWSGGSGVVVTAQGHVVTNCHVTEDGDFFRGYLFDGSHVEAKLIGQDALTDLAVLQLDLSQRPKGAAPLPVAKFGDSSKLTVGEEVFALGSPGFLSQSVTRGIVSNPSLVLPEQTVGRMMLRGEDVGQFVRWVLHDARIFGGNSGGPLVNARGEIVGINEIGVVSLSGAIPSTLAQAVTEQLIAHGRVTRGWSGLTVQPRLEADGETLGVVVGDVADGSPAAQAGLRPGDVILACDGQAIEGAEEKAVSHFVRLESSQLPGRDLVLDYKRAGQRATAKVKLLPREPARSDDTELGTWGVVVRDLTAKIVRNERLPDARGVWLENIRPAGPAGQAEPVLRREDVLVAVDGRPVGTVAELKAVTETLMADAPKGTRTVLASVRRDGAVLSAVVELRRREERNPPTQARKAWPIGRAHV